ncbi:hypothetical protein T11_4558 [Trichinella zimbabwensis]|uniref:Uncharacterized protein n=1 Tax=Trichinella zimbabwensis TaxID=268475 RepID=A0A0V1DRB5_9BILA|nr:hypothetical protein T11_10352 [Trichinella zimbabwensis]KRY64016.1 hypothetical protein T11_4558 [Trichinella zimbabwensis]
MLDNTDVSFTYGQTQALPTQDLMLTITFSPEFMQIC